MSAIVKITRRDFVRYIGVSASALALDGSIFPEARLTGIASSLAAVLADELEIGSVLRR